MTAWEWLQTRSAITFGSAWDRFTGPQIGGGGGVIVNDGIAVEVGTMQVEVELEDTPYEVGLEDPIQVELVPNVYELEIAE